jgi:hypothetical protein
LSAALEHVLEWAPAPRAVILSGSHASGEAVWTEDAGRPLSLSDIDFYVLLEDEALCRAARMRQSAARGGLARRCLEFGLAAPLEAGFHTTQGLARLPARPGTIELARHGRVVHGDPRALDLVPRFGPRDVSFEETLLLLENRGCELLWCRPRLAAREPLERAKGRHAVLKCALDLAGVEALLAGEYPDGARARVEWARRNGAPARGAGARERDRLWDAALAWRAGDVVPLERAEGEEEWAMAARAWSLAFGEASAQLGGASARVGEAATRVGEAAAQLGAGAGTSEARVLEVARRARLRRRLRDALLPRGNGPGRMARLERIGMGTLQHRVHASATLLLLGAAGGATSGALPPATAAALERLGVVPARAEWEAARRAVVTAWDRWLLDGQRTAEPE